MQIGEDERREGDFSSDAELPLPPPPPPLLLLLLLQIFFQLALRALLNFLSHGNELKR